MSSSSSLSVCQMMTEITTLISWAESEDLHQTNHSLSLCTVFLLLVCSQHFQISSLHCLSAFMLYSIIYNCFWSIILVSNHDEMHLDTLHYHFSNCFEISLLKNSYNLIFSFICFRHSDILTIVFQWQTYSTHLDWHWQLILSYFHLIQELFDNYIISYQHNSNDILRISDKYQSHWIS